MSRPGEGKEMENALDYSWMPRAWDSNGEGWRMDTLYACGFGAMEGNWYKKSWSELPPRVKEGLTKRPKREGASDALSKLFKNSSGQSAKSIQMKFIEPGLVHYNDVGTVLIRKETFDKFANTFIGKPVFNESHKPTTPHDFSNGKADGLISRVWYNQEDGWFWAEALVWDPKTIQNCKDGEYSVSCAYDVTQWSDSGGLHNNIEYTREVLNGSYTHMAIVADPRYEGAKIFINSQGGSMKWKFWEKGKTEEKASEVELANATVAIDGKDVPLQELVELHNAAELAKLPPKAFGMEDVIDVNGQKVAIKDLVALHNAKMKAKNEDEKDEKKEEKEEVKNEEEKDEEKKKKDEEVKNAEEKEEEKKKKDDEEMKNALDKKARAEGFKSFEELKNAAAKRGEPQAIPIGSRREQAKAGAERYGKSVEA